MKIYDQITMPDYNPAANAGRGDHSLYDVSNGEVVLRDGSPAYNDRTMPMTPHCVFHGAMNAMNPQRSVWRCLSCGRACYAQH